jgi:hypothetical protein
MQPKIACRQSFVCAFSRPQVDLTTPGPLSIRPLRIVAVFEKPKAGEPVDQGAADSVGSRRLRGLLLCDPTIKCGQRRIVQTHANLFGAEMAIVQKAMEAVQAIRDNVEDRSKEDIDAEQLHDALYSRLYLLVDNAMSQPARSLAGAMVQVGLLSHFMSEMQPCSDYSEITAKEVDQRCHFALRSIIEVLAKAAGVDSKDLSVDYWAGANRLLIGRFDAALAAERGGKC